VPDETAVIASLTAERRGWRPQEYGSKRSRDVVDPVIEPEWIGVRTLVHFDGESVVAVDEDGEELDLPPNVGVAIADAALASEFVLDGYLSAQPGRQTEGMVVGRVEGPSPGAVVRQVFIGTRRSDREGPPSRAIDIRPGDTIAFVAVDLLSIDGQSLLDVPLLERKRQLEGAIAESDLVRRGLYVRPPVERWLASWRAMGFGYVLFKAANGRYVPGSKNDTWSIWKLPPP
jgi:ATP-dependent DNA ligase